MKLLFLGTGTSTGVPQIGCNCKVCQSANPKDKRLRTSLLITVENKNILIDCGPDFRQQMLTNNVKHLDAVLLTHHHYDHIFGLDELRSFTNNKAMPICAEQYVEDTIKRTFPYCFGENKYPGVATFDMRTIDNREFEVSGVKVLPIRVMHYNLPILGYRIGNMAYITDMLTISEEEVEKLKSLDVLIINALRHNEHISHQRLTDALDIIHRVSPRRAYLVHMSHQMGLHDEISKQLPQNVYFAYDGLQIEI
ncbi:MAG: MBL fold metallo-hydrolase [Muribaculaceae bacterium]|nr:MBL fold metallo-hydrolase [Muribaculaceae bacterium]